MGYDVFISHSSQDKKIADEVCSHLENCDISCWMAPRDIRPGFNYDEEIIDGIEKTRAIIILISQHSNESQHVKRELELAVNQGSIILPIRIQNVQLGKSLKYYLAGKQFVDIFEQPLEKELKSVAQVINRSIINENQQNRNSKEWESKQGLLKTHKNNIQSAKVVIFNDSILIKNISGTAIEIEIDKKYIGELKRKEYLETVLEPGRHKLALRHKEFGLNQYYEYASSFEFSGDELYLQIKTGWRSTKFTIQDDLPNFFFKKYKKTKKI